jgi:hypothetical protein
VGVWAIDPFNTPATGADLTANVVDALAHHEAPQDRCGPDHPVAPDHEAGAERLAVVLADDLIDRLGWTLGSRRCVLHAGVKETTPPETGDRPRQRRQLVVT